MADQSPEIKKMHCSDGGSVYITGSVHNELVRLLGIDVPEIRGLDLDKLEESKFLYVLDDNLLEYLTSKLARKSIEIHKKLGFKAHEYLEKILDENLTVTFGREVFDRYGRPLVYLGDGQEIYSRVNNFGKLFREKPFKFWNLNGIHGIGSHPWISY
jgi:endonuclease YncB( thermonuclease family)